MQKPNILFFFPDQHRGDWLPYKDEILAKIGIDNLPLKMPNLKRIMEQGMTFTRAITPSPLCAPARACLAAGLRYDKCQVPDNRHNYPLTQPTFYSVLKENGYRVGGVGKFDLHKARYWWGEDGWIDELAQLGFTDGIDNAGKMDAILSYQNKNPFTENNRVEKGEPMQPNDPYMKYLHDRGLAQLHVRDMKARSRDNLITEPTDLPEEAYCDNWLSNNGLQMLEKFPEDQPWFLQVNFAGPHGPWDVTEEMREKWKDFEFPPPAGCADFSSEKEKKKINEVRQNYAAMLENIDYNIGLFIDEVKKRGEVDNTIIIYSSDHGEMLGDFGKWGKTHPERASVHIPLVISGPGVKKGVYSQALVELQDLTATIMDYCGLCMDQAQDSRSLRPVLAGESLKHRSYQVSAFNDWQLIADERYKLIKRKGEAPELYDLKEDPWEENDIAGGNNQVVEKLLADNNLS